MYLLVIEVLARLVFLWLCNQTGTVEEGVGGGLSAELMISIATKRVPCRWFVIICIRLVNLLKHMMAEWDDTTFLMACS